MTRLPTCPGIASAPGILNWATPWFIALLIVAVSFGILKWTGTSMLSFGINNFGSAVGASETVGSIAVIPTSLVFPGAI